MDLIYRIKAGNKGQQVVDDFITILKELSLEKNCQMMIIGCTELPIILPECLKKLESLKMDQLVNATEAIAEAIVKIGKGDARVSDYMGTDIL